MVNRWFGPRSGQIKYYKIDICCFSATLAALRRKSKDLLALNQDNVCEWGDMSFRGASTMQIQYNVDLIIISFKIIAWSPNDIAKKNAELALNNNHLLIHS